jgi:photosystem II stability/assembly factor-like uncharacterized protein
MPERSESPCSVFISYHEADRPWVDRWLLPRLERHGIIALVDYRDFPIGAPRLQNIEQAVDASARTIVVLSPEWVQSEWNAFEALLVQTQDPAARRRKLLPIVLRPTDLPPSLSTLEKLDLTAERHWEQQFPRLVRAIQDSVPVPFPVTARQVGDLAAWARWAQRYRGPLRRGLALALIAWCLLFALLQWPPFQPRTGWQALGGLPVRGAWRLAHAGSTLLISTDTDFLGCKALDTGLWRSTDGARSWAAITAPLEFERPGQGCVLASVVDFAAVASPRIYGATSDVGLLASADAGQSWRRIETDALPQRLTGVAVAPEDAGRIFVSAREGGLYRSTDAGRTWRRLDGAGACAGRSLPASLRVGAILTAADRVYIGSPDVHERDPRPDAGLYVSHDGGDCWQRIHDAEGRYRYRALAAAPNPSDGLLALTFDAHAASGAASVHLWLLHETPGQQRILWESRHTAVALEVVAALAPTWYVVTDLGEIFRGGLTQAGSEALPRIPQCALSCVTDLTSDFVSGPPLLLAQGRVLRLGTVPWYRRVWP